MYKRQDVYKEEDYTKASWAEFKPVLDKVNKVVKENESTSAEISSLIDELKACLLYTSIILFYIFFYGMSSST